MARRSCSVTRPTRNTGRAYHGCSERAFIAGHRRYGRAVAGAEVDVLSQLLATAREAVGHRQISLRVDTDSLETVYIEDRDGDLVVHDRGETWFYIATNP